MKNYWQTRCVLYFFLIAFNSNAQNVQWRSFNYDIRYQEPGCSDCFFTDPDPVFIFRTKDNGTPNWYFNAFVTENVNCNWMSTQFSPPTFAPPYVFAPWISTGISNQIQLQFDGWEPDPWPCNPDDADCGDFGDMTFNSGAPINASMHIGQHCEPCVLSNQIEHFRQCTSDGTTGTYSLRWRYEWRYNQAPTITTQPPTNVVYCIGSAATPLTVAVANDFYGRVGSNGMMRHIQWQVSNNTDCAGATTWTNIIGANAASFTPPQIAGTRLYRALITSNCNADFSNNTAFSNCSRITYHAMNGFSNAISGFPFGAGDNPPPVVSGVCGGTVLPNTTHNLSALLPPAVGAVANISDYTWSISGPGSISATSGSSVQFTAPPTPGISTITLTYHDVCASSDAVSTCIINTGSEACDFIYVSPTGINNAECGGPDNPCLNLSGSFGALSKVTTDRNHIRMAVGSYPEPNVIQISNNLIIEGRYQLFSGLWSKTSNTALATSLSCSGEQTIDNFIAHRLGFHSAAAANWKLIDLNINTTAATGQTVVGNGKSNYGIYIANGSTNYEITRCNIQSGNATAGLGRTTGTGFDGFTGGNGANGTVGDGATSGSCQNGRAGRQGGTGGSAGANATRMGETTATTGGGGGGGGVGGSSCGSGNNNCSGCDNGGSGGGGGGAGGNQVAGVAQTGGGDGNQLGGRAGCDGSNGCTHGGIGPGNDDIGTDILYQNHGRGQYSITYSGNANQNGGAYFPSIPSTATNIFVALKLNSGDKDLHVKINGTASTSNWDCRPYFGGETTEVCGPYNHGGGSWYMSIFVNNFTTGSTNTGRGWTVVVNYTDNGNGGGGNGGRGRSAGCNNNQTPGGEAGDSGFAGVQGNDATAQTAFSFGSYFVPGFGSNGTAGKGGGGGGGGGAGGCDADWTDASGSGGGGGAGGGGGGGAGAGGRGGGASFAIFELGITNNGNLFNSTLSSGTAGSGGIGGNGGQGGNSGTPGNGGSGVNDGRIGGAGGSGSAGGRGGNGASAPAGTNGQYVTNGVVGFPSSSIPNAPIVSLFYNNAKICQNSTLEITTSTPSWTLPSGWEFVRYNQTSVGSQWSNSFATAEITTINTSGVQNLVANGTTFNSYLHVREARLLPVINTPAIICQGGSLDLSASSWGNETEFRWEVFQGAQADNKGINTNLIFGPYDTQLATTGTFTTIGVYTIRYQVRETCCGWSRPVFATFEVEAPSAPPTGIDVIGMPYCLGGAITLTRLGGALASGASWEWFQDDCDGLLLSNQNEIQISPLTTTSYFLRAGAGSSCPPSDCFSIEVIAPQTSTVLSVNGDNATCLVNVDDWVQFYNGSGRLIASVNSNGFDLGNVTATTYLAADPHVMGSCVDTDPQWNTAAMARSFVITPTHPLTGSNTAKVRLYFTDGDWSNYLNTANNTTTANNYDTPSGIADMGLTKFSAITGPENGNPNDNCGNGAVAYILNAGSGNINSLNAFSGFFGTQYLEYTLTGFSELYPMYSGAFNSALPVEMSSFLTICDNTKIQLKWITASEYNASHYVIQSSRDGATWLKIGKIEAVGTTPEQSFYEFTDQNFGTVIYYRLIQVDTDGNETIFGPISVNCEIEENQILVFPNPNEGDFNVAIYAANTLEHAALQMIDNLGRVVQERFVKLAQGGNFFVFERGSLMAGMYSLRILGHQESFQTVRVVIR